MDYSILHENIINISLINIPFAFLQSCPLMRLTQINAGLLWANSLYSSVDVNKLHFPSASF